MGGKRRVRPSRASKILRNTPAHRALAVQFGNTALRLLAWFERDHPVDTRPRLAVEAILAWAGGTRELGMLEVRRLSLDAHAAAREAFTEASRYAARAAGHAIAIWHVPTHAKVVSHYEHKVLEVLNDVARSEG